MIDTMTILVLCGGMSYFGEVKEPSKIQGLEPRFCIRLLQISVLKSYYTLSYEPGTEGWVSIRWVPGNYDLGDKHLTS
jgi:hypothetical protein